MSETPTTIDACVNGIVARLAAKYPTYDVQPYPDKPDGYRMLNQNGAFLVAYRGADHSEVDDTDVVVTARRMLLDVHVVAHDLNGAHGATAMIELARQALVGFTLPGFDRIVPVRERFVGRTETNWMYALTIGAATLAVQADDEGADPPAATTITAASQYGSSVAT